MIRRSTIAALAIVLPALTLVAIAPGATADSNDSPGTPSFAAITAGGYHSCAAPWKG
jgi:hypothetical protein